MKARIPGPTKPTVNSPSVPLEFYCLIQDGLRRDRCIHRDPEHSTSGPKNTQGSQVLRERLQIHFFSFFPQFPSNPRAAELFLLPSSHRPLPRKPLSLWGYSQEKCEAEMDRLSLPFLPED